QKKYIDILENSSYEIIGLANDIIDIVNLSRNEIKLSFDKISLIKLLEECKSIIFKDIDIKNLNLNIIIDENIPEILIIDVIRLKQIIINFLNNAVYFTNIGGITIEVNIYNDDNNLECPF